MSKKSIKTTKYVVYYSVSHYGMDPEGKLWKAFKADCEKILGNSVLFVPSNGDTLITELP